MTTESRPDVMPTEWKYQSERVVLVPYVENSTVFTPDILVRLWAMCERDGLMDLVFAGATEPMTLNRFVAYMSRMPIVIGLVKPMPGSPETMKSEIAGFGWLWGVEGGSSNKKAMIGMCFFRPFWRTPEIRELSRLTLRWWFDELNIGVLFGTIRKMNGVAMNFGKKLGFSLIAKIPNWYCQNDGTYEDVLLVTLTKDQFLEKLASGRRT